MPQLDARATVTGPCQKASPAEASRLTKACGAPGRLKPNTSGQRVCLKLKKLPAGTCDRVDRTHARHDLVTIARGPCEPVSLYDWALTDCFFQPPRSQSPVGTARRQSPA
jgi:hypothetical protein